MGKYDMKIVKMALKDCISPDYNPRKISNNEFQKLKHSIKTYGYNDPIIINQRNNHIIAGNQRHKALTELNKENHGKYKNIDVVLVDLPPNDEKSFNIGHNKISGDFDEEKLEELLQELEEENYDMSLTGFGELDDDLSEFLEENEETELIPTKEDLGDIEYVLTIKCASQDQQNYLFQELRNRGYHVKATQY